jgi:hypothetical protein
MNEIINENSILDSRVFITQLLLHSPLCRCGVKEETSAHILCECEALASLRHTYLGSFFLELEDIKSISLEAIWNFSKVTELLSPRVAPTNGVEHLMESRSPHSVLPSVVRAVEPQNIGSHGVQ